MSIETNTTGTRTLTFESNAYGDIAAWVIAPEYPTPVLVGVFSARPEFTHTWIAQYGDPRSSVRQPDLNQEGWENLIRLVHLHV